MRTPNLRNYGSGKSHNRRRISNQNMSNIGILGDSQETPLVRSAKFDHSNKHQGENRDMLVRYVKFEHRLSYIASAVAHGVFPVGFPSREAG